MANSQCTQCNDICSCHSNHCLPHTEQHTKEKRFIPIFFHSLKLNSHQCAAVSSFCISLPLTLPVSIGSEINPYPYRKSIRTMQRVCVNWLYLNVTLVPFQILLTHNGAAYRSRRCDQYRLHSSPPQRLFPNAQRLERASGSAVWAPASSREHVHTPSGYSHYQWGATGLLSTFLRNSHSTPEKSNKQHSTVSRKLWTKNLVIIYSTEWHEGE